MSKDQPVRSAAATDDTLFPPIEAHASGHLAVDPLHRLYWEESGNPTGVPVVFLHGGPGGGVGPQFRRFFDPAFYRIVLFDQRGSGRSTPFAEVRNNTTWHLVDDIEALRRHLKVEQWLVFGGSWGSTLALAYAQSHPQRCLGLILRGIFLCTDAEIDWFVNGMGQFFPEAARHFRDFLPAGERADPLASYYRRLTDPDPQVHGPAARVWSSYEEACSRLVPTRGFSDPAAGPLGRPEPALALARLEAHYMVNRGFLTPDQLMAGLGRLHTLPVTIVQGRYDVVCPIVTADRVARALPECRYVVVPDAGHSALEPGIRRALVEATEDYKRLHSA